MKQKLTYFRRTRTFVLSLLLLSCMAAQGQQQPSRMVKGLVKDARTGEPLAGVAVLVRGTTQGTTTGISGEYAVSVPSGSTELEFSFLGYVAKIQKIGTAHTLDVTMEEEATGLQEVVVVGYGVQKKANLAGVGLKRCNDLIYRVVTSLYKRVGNEKATVYFQPIALKYRISNNLLQDMKNFRDRQIYIYLPPKPYSAP